MVAPVVSLALLWRPVGEPLWIVAGAAVVGGLAVVAMVRAGREKPVAAAALLVMRLCVIAVLAGLLMGPSRLSVEEKAPRRSRLCILVDTSRSMSITDCAGRSRLRFAAEEWLGPGRLDRLRRTHQVDVLAFDERLSPLVPADAEAEGSATALDRCLAQALAERWTRREADQVLIISDGHDTERDLPARSARVARRRDVTIHAVCLGGANEQPDLALVATPAQEFLLIDEPGTLAVRVHRSGLDGLETRLIVRSEDRVVGEIPIEFGGDRVVEVTIPIEADRPGEKRYDVLVEHADGEVETRNNEQSVFIDVVRDRLRVLLLEGQPYWDTKFLAQSLRKDERIELTQLTQLAPEVGEEAIVTRSDVNSKPRVPRTADEFAEYDLVILGHEVGRLLDADGGAGLADFVGEQGGHLIFARGRPYDPRSRRGVQLARAIEVIEPVAWGEGHTDDLTLELTATGRRSAWLATEHLGIDADEALSRLPGFAVMPRIADEKIATRVLVRARPTGAPSGDPDEGAPALVTMRYGRGTVAAVLGEGLWRWSLLEREQRDLHGFYDAFWSNLARWLVMGGTFQPGQQVALRLDSRSVQVGEPFTVDVVSRRVVEEAPALFAEVTDAEGRTPAVPLHRVPGRDAVFRASVTPEMIGVHRVAVRTEDDREVVPSQGFSAYELDLELLESSARPAVLQHLVHETGGVMFRPSEADDLVRRLERHQLATIVPREPVYAWDRAWILLGLLTWVGLEWIARRKAGFA